MPSRLASLPGLSACTRANDFQLLPWPTAASALIPPPPFPSFPPFVRRNTPVANDVKNDIKDMMRDTCIERLAGIWEGVLFEALDHG